MAYEIEQACVDCGQTFKDAPRRPRCRECDRHYWNWREPQKRRAGSAITNAVAGGHIPPAKLLLCVDCGGQAAHYDHRDYGKPYEIAPVCRSCNVRRGPAKFPIPYTPRVVERAA